jgi:hypothetical protein
MLADAKLGDERVACRADELAHDRVDDEARDGTGDAREVPGEHRPT